jgi:hypothetical protein
MTYEKGVSVSECCSQSTVGIGRWTLSCFVGGGNTEHLQRQAWELGIWDKCYFTGFMSDDPLNKFQTLPTVLFFRVSMNRLGLWL